MSKFSLKNISISQAISIVLIVLALIFMAQNFGNVPIHIILWKFEIPLFILLVITGMIGFFTAVAFGKANREDYEVTINHKEKI